MSINEQKELKHLLKMMPSKAVRASSRGVRLYNMDIDEEEVVSGCKNQWTTSDSVRYFPAGKTSPQLNPGVYEIKTCQSGIYFEKVPIKTEGLIEFPETNSQKVVQEIENFWSKEDVFKSQGLTFKRGIILWGPAGCHAKGTKILMYDGSSKNIEDVRVGDLLMGPDSSSRKVLELRRGRDIMYQITPVKGDSFVVNANHVLSLQSKDSEILNLKVSDYLKLSKIDKKKFNLRKIGMANTGIKNITCLGEGDYYGFTCSSDHLYLTEDFTVHHNSGKSCTIQLIIADVTQKRNGVVFKLNTNPSLFLEGIRIFREVQPNTPVVVLMEDIDAIIQMYDESEVLNILDGVDLIDKTIFLATTNYPEELGERIMNRPSRFDKRFKMPHPKAKSRKVYLEYLISKGTIDLPVDLDRWVKDTEGMSIAHLKELFIAVCILGEDYKETIETLRIMAEEKPSSKDDLDGCGIGFKA